MRNGRALLFCENKMRTDLNTRIDRKINEISDFYINNFNPLESPLSLFDGLGGIGLFFFEKINSRLCTNEDKDFFIKIFDVIYDKLNKENYSLTYCDGLTGIAFFIRLCKDYLESEGYDVNELITDIDEIIFKSVVQSAFLLEHDSFDFLHGKLGILHYLITFRVRPCLTEKFYKTICLNLLENLQKAQRGEASFNFGLAHGMCSYINIIIKANQYFPDIPDALKLLKFIEEIYLCKNLDFSKLSLYPSISNKKDFNKNASFFQPLGWCYGDQTISTSLLKLGICLDSQELIDHSLHMSNHWKQRNTVAKALGNPSYYDFSFCHGVTSVAFFNKRWYDITGDPQFLENYLYFLELITSQVQQDGSIAGFRKCTGDDTLYKKDWGLLTGSAGIGLNLIYQRSNNNNKWLKLFLYE